MMLYSTLLGVLPLVTGAVAHEYTLIQTYNASNFFDEFTFYSGADPTGGFVDYSTFDEAILQKLISNASDYVYLGVDHENPIPDTGVGRPSVRLESKLTFTEGLFVLDLRHLPVGCGTWPSFWTVGLGQWPADGEIDIIEGVNDGSRNEAALHASGDCRVSKDVDQTGVWKSTDCNIDHDGNQGCGSQFSEVESYGTPFNDNGGGIYAMEWTNETISIWFFTPKSVPSSLLRPGSIPDTSEFGTPSASFYGPCSEDLSKKFFNHTLIIDTTFCGGWGGTTFGKGSSTQCVVAQGSTSADSCKAFVANNPASFNETYWAINSLRVWQKVASLDILFAQNTTGSGNATQALPDDITKTIEPKEGDEREWYYPDQADVEIKGTEQDATTPDVSSLTGGVLISSDAGKPVPMDPGIGDGTGVALALVDESARQIPSDFPPEPPSENVANPFSIFLGADQASSPTSDPIAPLREEAPTIPDAPSVPFTEWKIVGKKNPVSLPVPGIGASGPTEGVPGIVANLPKVDAQIIAATGFPVSPSTGPAIPSTLNTLVDGTSVANVVPPPAAPILSPLSDPELPDAVSLPAVLTSYDTPLLIAGVPVETPAAGVVPAVPVLPVDTKDTRQAVNLILQGLLGQEGVAQFLDLLDINVPSAPAVATPKAKRAEASPPPYSYGYDYANDYGQDQDQDQDHDQDYDYAHDHEEEHDYDPTYHHGHQDSSYLPPYHKPTKTWFYTPHPTYSNEAAAVTNFKDYKQSLGDHSTPHAKSKERRLDFAKKLIVLIAQHNDGKLSDGFLQEIASTFGIVLAELQDFVDTDLFQYVVDDSDFAYNGDYGGKPEIASADAGSEASATTTGEDSQFVASTTTADPAELTDIPGTEDPPAEGIIDPTSVNNYDGYTDDEDAYTGPGRLKVKRVSVAEPEREEAPLDVTADDETEDSQNDADEEDNENDDKEDTPAAWDDWSQYDDAEDTPSLTGDDWFDAAADIFDNGDYSIAGQETPQQASPYSDPYAPPYGPGGPGVGPPGPNSKAIPPKLKTPSTPAVKAVKADAIEKSVVNGPATGDGKPAANNAKTPPVAAKSATPSGT